MNVRCSWHVLVVLLIVTFLLNVPQVQPMVSDNWWGHSDWLRRAGLDANGSSNVTFFVSPALQVNITFNGQNYTNGQSDIFLDGIYNATATLAKSLTTIPSPPSNCPPGTYYTSIWQFHDWTATSNLTIQGSMSSKSRDPSATWRPEGFSSGSNPAGAASSILTSLTAVLCVFASSISTSI